MPNRINFPDPSEFPGGVIPVGAQHPQNGQLFKYDGHGWTKQILSGNIVIDPDDLAADRLLPENPKENARLKVEGGTWQVDDALDGGTY